MEVLQHKFSNKSRKAAPYLNCVKNSLSKHRTPFVPTTAVNRTSLGKTKQFKTRRGKIHVVPKAAVNRTASGKTKQFKTRRRKRHVVPKAAVNRRTSSGKTKRFERRRQINLYSAPCSTCKTADKCKLYLSKICGGYFDGQRERRCFEQVANLNFTGKSHLTKKYSRMNYSTTSQNKPSGITLHNQCISNAQRVSQNCNGLLRSNCIKSSVRSAKLIRMRMENVKHILTLNPNIKIIHNFRDPRATVYSKSVATSRKDPKRNTKIVEIAKGTCKKMRQDFAARDVLEEQYPHKFFTLRYEDLVFSPLATVERLYSFIDAGAVPASVHRFLKQNMKSHLKVGRGRMSVRARNATVSATRWKTELSKQLITGINKQCHDILHRLNYDIM